jgi:hypothetical protein
VVRHDLRVNGRELLEQLHALMLVHQPADGALFRHAEHNRIGGEAVPPARRGR